MKIKLYIVLYSIHSASFEQGEQTPLTDLKWGCLDGYKFMICYFYVWGIENLYIIILIK